MPPITGSAAVLPVGQELLESLVLLREAQGLARGQASVEGAHTPLHSVNDSNHCALLASAVKVVWYNKK